jgi:hypothetical protein
MRIIHCTAATLRAVLCYINSGVTPNIAYDRDELAVPLADKLKASLGELGGGSQPCALMFTDDEKELRRQFEHIRMNIESIFHQLKGLCQD